MIDDFDLEITSIKERDAGGTWVSGEINGCRFDALVFEDQAEIPEYELGRSKISKLWIQRRSDRKTLYNWDRGLDIEAADAETQAIVDFLSEGLADFAEL